MKIGYLMQAGVPDLRQYPLTGPANHVKHVFNELRNIGHELCLLACLDRQIWKSADLENFNVVKVGWLSQNPFCLFEKAVRRLQCELRLPYAALFESIRFAQACRLELSDYDIFYERMGWMGYGGGLASHWMNIPLILEVNGDHLSELEMLGMKPSGVQRWLSILLMMKAAHQPAHVVATGEGWRQRYIERWGVNPIKVSVVENGTEMVELLQRKELKCFQTAESFQDSVNLIYIGAFEPWQGLDILLAAIAKVLTRGICLQLILVGSGSLFNAITQLSCKLGIQEYVTITGYLNNYQTAEWLTKADIGLSPYCGRKEFSGLKLLDYKAAGLATIASGENGQPAIIKNGQTGLVVRPCCEEALSEAIVQLCTDSELRKRMGKKARIEAEAQHSWRSTVEQLARIFAQEINS
jgi:glycosyltransferase involved in cell wall biosynthesis